MHLTVRGRHVDIGDALRTHVSERIQSITGKYFGDAIEANVTFTQEPHEWRADVSIHAGRGILLQSHAAAGDPYPAFDQAAERVAKRLRRYKRRLRDHHAAPVTPAAEGRYVVLAPAPDATDEPDDAPAPDGDGTGEPVIVAELRHEIATLTVAEAVMRLELGELPALMFRNRAHDGLNMVYRRPDGTVGWVDPARTA